MKKMAKVFIFILAFQLEVRVRASDTSILEQPDACLKTAATCAVQVLSSGFHLKNKSEAFHASAGSTILRLASHEWRLVKGAMWVEKGPLKVQTPYASLQATRGQYWVINEEDRITVRNMNAELSVTMRDGKVVQVPEGFEFWVGGLGASGKSDYGMIRPIDMKEHLPLWNALYVGTKEDFKKEVLNYKMAWGDLAVQSSGIYKEVITRRIAAEENQQRLLELRQKQKAEEARRLRELYWKRSFER